MKDKQGAVTTDPKEVQKIIGEHFEILHSKIMENIQAMVTFLNAYYLSIFNAFDTA